MTSSATPTPPTELPIVILLVEDNADLRMLTSDFLSDVGFEVVATQSARDAFAAIDSGIHIDLVFSDINMPGAIDGIGLARWLSVNRPLLPVILTSGNSHPGLELSTLRRRFVQKPYLLETIEHDIRELVEAASIH